MDWIRLFGFKLSTQRIFYDIRNRASYKLLYVPDAEYGTTAERIETGMVGAGEAGVMFCRIK